jgi:hypothetical protein
MTRQQFTGRAERLLGQTGADGMALNMTRSWVALALFAGFGLVVGACGDDGDTDGELSAEFTGDGCVYSGPIEFEVGDEIEITATDVTEERMDVGYAVRKVTDGTTFADISEEGVSAFAAQNDDGTLLYSEVTEEGTERVLSVTLDVAGTWAMECFAFSPDGAFPATTFEVVDAS